MRRGHHGSKPASAAAPARGVTLDVASGQVVLLGLISAEAVARCTEHRERISKDLDAKVLFEEQHYPDDAAKWLQCRRMWRPVTCELEFLPATSTGLTAAPSILLVARRDDGKERSVRFSVCQRGLVRIELQGWPEGIRAPIVLKDPTTLSDAVEWAARVVAAAMPPLLDFVDPMR